MEATECAAADQPSNVVDGVQLKIEIVAINREEMNAALWDLSDRLRQHWDGLENWKFTRLNREDTSSIHARRIRVRLRNKK
jgi:hypothetical protein